MKNKAKHLLIFVLIQFSKCEIETFVVGGELVDISKYPHSAFTRTRCQAPAICGSAVLNQKIIITAAHCVQGCKLQTDLPDRIIIYLGNENLTIRQMTIIRKVTDLRIHPDYNDRTFENDIALAMVRKFFPLGSNVKRVVISEKFPNSAYAFDTYVAGWGIINRVNQDCSILLKHVAQKIRSEDTCAVIGHLHEGMFCAGSTEKTADHPAPGDSGSALVTASGYHQVGLVSFSVNKYPALIVYTNVSYYYEWISENSKIMYCKN